MEDRIVSFKTAKLAKDAGFDWETLFHYHIPIYRPINKDDDSPEVAINSGNLNWNATKISCESFQCYSAPTQNQLSKWLREVKRILLQVTPIDSWNNWTVCAYNEDMRGLFDMESSYVEFETYEDALEFGLMYTLKHFCNPQIIH